jgi:hypothetical protein
LLNGSLIAKGGYLTHVLALYIGHPALQILLALQPRRHSIALAYVVKKW